MCPNATCPTATCSNACSRLLHSFIIMRCWQIRATLVRVGLRQASLMLTGTIMSSRYRCALRELLPNYVVHRCQRAARRQKMKPATPERRRVRPPPPPPIPQSCGVRLGGQLWQGVLDHGGRSSGPRVRTASQGPASDTQGHRRQAVPVGPIFAPLRALGCRVRRPIMDGL